MKIVDLSSEEEKVRTIYRIVAISSATIMVFLASYAILMSYLYGTYVVGETLVNLPTGRPFEFPQPELFPVYAKPVTWLYISIIGFGFSVLELNKKKLANLSGTYFSIVQFIVFVVAAISAYEIFYNFSIWSALMAFQAIRGEINPDVVIVAFPNPEIPWNLVFATKLFSSIFIVSVYVFYYLLRIRK